MKSLGDKALDEGKNEIAIKNYKKAIFAEPQFAEAWSGLAHVYKMQLEYNNALQAFEKAISIDPVYGEALFGKAVVLHELGRDSEAFQLANYILSLYQDSDVERFRDGLIQPDKIGNQTTKRENHAELEGSSIQRNVEIPKSIDEQDAADIRFCRRCGVKLLADSIFCHRCGTKIIGE